MFAGIFRNRFWVAPALAGAVNTHRLKPVLPRAVWVAAIVLLCSPAAPAHEIGTTRVAVLFEQGRTYDIEIVTDAVSLVDKLEALAGSPSLGETNATRLQSILVSFEESFRRRVNVTFDASDVHPAIAYSVAPASAPGAVPAATIRLTGRIPSGARRFSWTFGWTFASYALTLRSAASDNPATEWLEGNQSNTPFTLTSPAPTVNRLRTAWRYLTLGFTHILPYGLDHMLFMLGIFLLSGRARSVLWQVSAFTIAHSITLGLSMYGVIAAPPRIVEPMIAISIAYVAIENIFLSELKPWRVALVFAFGLLHGMGFAGALKELGLPRSEFLTALLTFNVGVEAGQLTVIGAAFLLVGWHCANRAWYRSRIVVPASAMIAFTAVYWTIQRLSV
jgi:hydrogenase/urease accessory protein HupE